MLFGGYDANCTIGPLDSAISPDHECLDEAESLNYDSDSDIEDDDDDTETASPKAYRKSAPDVPSTKDDKSMPVSHSPYSPFADCLNAGSQGICQSRAGYRA